MADIAYGILIDGGGNRHDAAKPARKRRISRESVVFRGTLGCHPETVPAPWHMPVPVTRDGKKTHHTTLKR